jgi:hypothetical protein
VGTRFESHDEALSELAEVADGDELCRLLLQSSSGWGSSTQHREVLQLLEMVHGDCEMGDELLTLLLCTCRRWDRVTAKVIAAIEDSGLVAGADLDGLAESFVTVEVIVEFPLAWISLDWVEFDPEDGSTRHVTVDADTMTTSLLRPAPPLRRWAAARILAADPSQLGELFAAADRLAPLHRDAIIHGLVDACDSLPPDGARRVVRRGLRTGQGRVRRCALDRLCQLDGPEAAQRRAKSDPDATVRSWRPPLPPAMQLL